MSNNRMGIILYTVWESDIQFILGIFLVFFINISEKFIASGAIDIAYSVCNSLLG